jgi:sugar phosphate isomerase/epimerase
VNRRDFLTVTTAAGLVSVATRRAAARRPVEPLRRVGLQLFTIPKLLDRDFAGALKLVADIGYKEVQLFGPYPFSAPTAHERWKPVSSALGLNASGFYGLSPRELKAVLDRNSLSAPAMHVDMDTLRTRLSEAADAADALDTKYIGISSIPADERRTLDGYKRAADEFNQIGARASKLGVRFTYHNHGYGWTELEGQIPLRVVLDRVDLLDTYRGRYRLMHVKDMKQRVRFRGDGGDEAQWVELFPYMTDAGSGVLDLPAILGHAKRSGVEHFFVEQDLATNPEESLRKSYRFLSGLDL